MMKSAAVGAFNLDEEDGALRDAYGRNVLGQGCLLARRLVEQGVSFVEVSLNGCRWQPRRRLGYSRRQLRQRQIALRNSRSGLGHVDERSEAGADCWSPRWLCGQESLGDAQDQREFRAVTTGLAAGALCWAGVEFVAVRCLEKPSDDGMEILDSPVKVPDFMATICAALGLDHQSTNQSNIGRPIPFADHGAQPLQAILG